MTTKLQPKLKFRRDDGVAVLTKRGKAERILYSFAFLLFSLYALTIVYALFYLFINSFQDKLTYIDNLAAGKPVCASEKTEAYQLQGRDFRNGYGGLVRQQSVSSGNVFQQRLVLRD